MACRNPHFKNLIDHKTGKKINGFYVQYPCRWCINCRIDKLNYWKDRLNYEHLKKVSSAFVTFTYDNINIPHPEAGGSLLRYDFESLINNLRNRTRRIKNQWAGTLNRKDWTYYGVGEYGDQFGRPHYHILFFGLDFWQAKQMFKETWPYGIIDSLPILDGGIGYVLDYINKQVHGKQSLEKYEANGLESPFTSCTPGIGNSLFFDQKEYCIEHGSYKNLAGKERPLEPYYLNLLKCKKELTHYPEKLLRWEHEYKDQFNIYKIDQYEQELLYARERFIGEKLRQKRIGTEILPNSPNAKYGSLRNFMYRQWRKNMIKEFEVYNQWTLEKLKEHQGEKIKCI